MGLHTLDIVSTLNGIKNANIQESNPTMKGIVTRPVLFIATKTAFATGSILLLDRFVYKENPRKAKILLAAANIGMTYVVTNNIALTVRMKF